MSMKSSLRNRIIIQFILSYLIALLIILTIVVVMLVNRGNSLQEVVEFMPDIFRLSIRQPLFHIVLLIPFLLLKIFHFIRKKYKTYGAWSATTTFSTHFGIPGLIIYIGIRALTYYSHYESFDYRWDNSVENTKSISSNHWAQDGKHRGIHIFSIWNDLDNELNQLVKNNVEWITIVPYGFQPEAHTPSLEINPRNFTRRDSLYRQISKKAKQRQLHIMLKPHIWMNEGWRSEIAMQTEEDWQKWFRQYDNFIVHYARLAEEIEATAFCIGVEMYQSVKQRPEYWRHVIDTVRSIYSGKLTYAANWDREFKEVNFWNQLDYIGIQAYYPLSKKNNPTIKELTEGWQKYHDELKDLSTEWQRPILFTEVGYKSTKGSAKEPWVWESPWSMLFRKVSYQTQVNTYEALFETFWEEPWFAGVHLWKWEGDDPFDFTPKNKPAENIMAKWFKSNHQKRHQKIYIR